MSKYLDLDGLTYYNGKVQQQITQLEAEVHNLSGRFYGVFDDDSDLPEEGDAVGYAFVGTEEPLTLFTFDGSDWTDTEIEISGIVGPPGPEGQEGPQGIQGPPGVTSAAVTVDNTSGTPSATATVVDGVLSLHLSGIKGIQGDTGVSADYPITIANNLSTDDPTSALAASQGVVLKGEIEQANAAIKEPFNEGVYGYVWKKGTVNDNHQYTQNSNTRICMCFPAETPLSFEVASGYFASIHCYSQIFTDVTQITSGSSWLGNIDSSWKSGTVSVAPLTGTKTYFILVKKGDAGTSTVSPSEGLVAVTDIYIKQSLQDEIIKLKADDSVEKGFNGVWLQGSLSGTNAYSSSYSNRIITAFPCTGLITIRLAAGYKVAIHSYSVSYDNASEITNGTYYIESLTSGGWVEDGITVKQSANGKTFVIIVAKTDDSSIVPSESSDGVLSIVGEIPFIDDYDELAVSVRGYERLWRNDKPTITWKQGSLSNSHAYMNMTTRIIAAVPWAGSLDIVVATGYYVSIHCYSQIFTDATQITSGSSWLGNIDSSWKEGTVRVSQLPSGLTYVLIVKKGSAGTDTIAPSDASTAITALVGEDIKVEGLIDRVGTDTGSYVWSADCLKRGVTVKQIGTLQYLQAFCVYGNKYYSTNGSAIAEQDVLFNVLRDVSINVGHGNSLQLVSGGKAWASGWNDQKMYRVDLSTLAVDNTITLPTTGYTTAAVDEDNGLMYIFQRDSYPSSIAQYNFIKYDYANEQIISTRKIESFAAMQGIDLYEGKILMLYGLGTSSAPCGMRIYNTAGDVLATFDLAIFASTESECIMFERDTRKILVSDVNKKIYEVVE